MRIISGKNRGRQITAPNNLPVRPTTDMAKESLFNILNNYFYFDRVTVLDLFAGTGNLTYEFASREALSVTSVDSYQACTDFIRRTVDKLGYGSQVSVVKADAFLFTQRCRQQFDIIFADPPYDLENIGQIVDNVFNNKLLKPDGWLIIEHSKDHDFSQHPQFYQHRKYGKVNFSFLVNMTETEDSKKEDQE
ncbi:MAG: 16S rRNA (guanine(966)-N(2))-methyltransferase RsmD [Bacteroidales bacterium]|nr:16S rRNA (guanine(966)-N(2))-methyltransferase RsmD [Bacteroidales bacterium]